VGIAITLNHVIETILVSKKLTTLGNEVGTYACPHLMDFDIEFIN
jgi:hypothetical protein